VTPRQVRSIGPTMMTKGSGLSGHQGPLSSWVLIVLLIGGILLMSLAAEAATARPLRESLGWGLFLIAWLPVAYLAYVDARTSTSSWSVGLGYELAGAGCVCAVLGSSLWILAVRRQLPRRSLSTDWA
jgi:hypothetical protein